MADLEGLYRESKAHLQGRLLPFWSRLQDEARGGYYGLVTDDLMVHRDADKGCVLNSRILWFFSEAYRTIHSESALQHARHAFHFLRDAFVDKEMGGVYWSVTAEGAPADESKHCYCQAFAVYALAAYARAEIVNSALAIRDGNLDDGSAAAALELAYSVFDVIETKMRDEEGYLEEFTRDFKPAVNNKLSGNGVEAERTMNTTLHLLEAYTELYLADGSPKVHKRIAAILDLFLDKIYIPERSRLGVFFDLHYHPVIDLYSYGHDIEAAWLIDRAVSAIRDYGREAETRKMSKALTAAVYSHAYREDEGFASLPAECESGVDKPNRVWWIQAEAVNGFLNGVQVAMAEGETALGLKYADAVGKLWAFIRADIIDPREEGEWFGELDEDGMPDHRMPVVDLWKCPYHNGRMCMEIMHRINKEDDKEDVAQTDHPVWRRTNWQPPEELAELASRRGGHPAFADRYYIEKDRQDRLLAKKNEPVDEYNGIFTRYANPVLTREHVPLTWRYDLNPETNPRFMERLGINAVMNSGAIYMGGKYCLVARIEGNDRKSFFGIAESDNGIDNFRFRDYPILLEDTCPQETNVYDMRLTQHEDGWIYGVFCSESKDTSSKDLSAAVAAAGIVRTRDLVNWERLPNLVTKRSPQQRNVVLHPEFVGGKYAFYTRPMDDFIETGSGGGIGFGLCKDITHAVIDEEKMTSLRRYHQITEAKNGEGAVPIRTQRGWVHIAHGVRNTAAGLRYVLYAFATDLRDPSRVIAEPGGLLLGPRGGERVGDVSNVVFTNGCIVRENGDVYLYYAGSDTRMYVATTTIDRLTDYVFNTPPDAGRSVLCVRQRMGLIERNLKYMESLGE